jgi:transposase-like protein
MLEDDRAHTRSIPPGRTHLFATAIAEPTRQARRRLTTEQQREIVRLYVDSNAPIGDICRQFGIAASVLYRVLKRTGAPLRQRGEAPAGHARTPGRPSAQRRGGAETSARGDTSRFRVYFKQTRIFEAPSIHNALDQALGSGATDILEITRES